MTISLSPRINSMMSFYLQIEKSNKVISKKKVDLKKQKRKILHKVYKKDKDKVKALL